MRTYFARVEPVLDEHAGMPVVPPRRVGELLEAERRALLVGVERVPNAVLERDFPVDLEVRDVVEELPLDRGAKRDEGR